MTDHKYLSDGRKVALVGKLNNEEWVVQEVFVTEAGDEIPSGERFTAKSLHDAPVESWKDRDLRKKEQRIKDLEVRYDRIQDNLRKAQLDESAKKDITKSLRAMAEGMDQEALENLRMFLCGEVKWLVVERGYSLELPEPFDQQIQDIDSWGNRRRYDGLKLISLFGKANGDLSYRLNRYRDGSGSDDTIIPFAAFEKAARYCIGLALDKANEGRLGVDDVQKLLASDVARHLSGDERNIIVGVLRKGLEDCKANKRDAMEKAGRTYDDRAAKIEQVLASAGATA